MVKWVCWFDEDVKTKVDDECTTDVAAPVGTQHVPQTNSAPDNSVHHGMDDEDDDTAPDICCLKGCLASWTIGLLIFFILPVGIFVTVYSGRTDDTNMLVAGIVLMVSPVVAIPALVVFLMRKKKRRLEKQGQSP